MKNQYNFYTRGESMISNRNLYFEPTWNSLDKRPIPHWFNQAKFGIFIHWGVYSVPSWRALGNDRYESYAEWYYARVMNDTKNGGNDFHCKNYGKDFEYRDFAPLFKAELFNPDFWADTFYKSGAKYVVLTAKHHDGYCLWPTKSTYNNGWNSMDTGPQRDLVGELTEAVRKKGLKMGLYYSCIEWETNRTSRLPSGHWLNPEIISKYSIPEDKYVNEHFIHQLKELISWYQPSLIFADGGEWEENEEYWKTKEFLSWLYNNAPNKDEVVVNDRFYKDMPGKHGDYFSSEYHDTDIVGPKHPWEESRGIGNSYGFNRAENLDDYKSSTELIHELISIISRGGNFLLNIGPTADGRIPVIMQQRIRDIGDWLTVNGEAVYGSTAVKEKIFSHDKHVYFSQHDTDIFVITTRWPEKNIVIQGNCTDNIHAVSLLGSDCTIDWNRDSSGLSIIPPDLSPITVPCNHAYVFKLTIAQ